jgi:hypothetical protein
VLVRGGTLRWSASGWTARAQNRLFDVMKKSNNRA